MSDAGSHPRAVVIMNFNTDSTSAAVEGSWWPQNFATLTIAHFIMFIFTPHFFDIWFIHPLGVAKIKVFKFPQIIKPFNVTPDILVPETRIKLLSVQILHVILLFRINFKLAGIRNNRFIGMNTWNNSRICRWTFVELSQAEENRNTNSEWEDNHQPNWKLLVLWNNDYQH